MIKYIKIFAILAVVCVVSSLPVEEIQVENVNEPLVDLLSVESSPITDTNSDELARDKRHGFGGFGGGYGGGYGLAKPKSLHKKKLKRQRKFCSFFDKTFNEF